MISIVPNQRPTPACERPVTWGGITLLFAEGSDHDTLQMAAPLGDDWMVHAFGADFRVLGYEEDDGDLFLRLAPADPDTGDELVGYPVLRVPLDGPVPPTITVY